MKYLRFSHKLIIVLIVSSCNVKTDTQSKNSADIGSALMSENKEGKNSSNQLVGMTFEDKALLCRCLYDELNFSRGEEKTDGSIDLYFNSDEFNLEGYMFEVRQMNDYLDTVAFRSYRESTLAIGKCIQAVEVIANSRPDFSSKDPIEEWMRPIKMEK